MHDTCVTKLTKIKKVIKTLESVILVKETKMFQPWPFITVECLSRVLPEGLHEVLLD